MANTRPTLVRRQIWADPTATSSGLPHTCTGSILPSGGLINVGGGTILTLSQDGVFQPYCSDIPIPQPVDPMEPGVDLSIFNYQEPFYSSTNPQIYAIAAMTVVSYMLVIILFITPRTFFMGGAGGGISRFGQSNMVGGAYGSNTIIGIGTRPWLQKIATLAVAISLTIVTADTLNWAKTQYNAGYQDALELSNMVLDGLEVRIVRVISEMFLWLAQAQTLIRLFPRHKEKLIIKWSAFALITADVVFDILNQFVDQSGKHHPRTFVTAIPALSYLFALSLNVAYALFVAYYAMTKLRFAFYRPQMRNMPLLALLSLTAILIPLVFFTVDLCAPSVSGWGSYIRWVGAAAASVVVWEWVERIETLERDEKKDGILGREIFDGDEMLEATPSSEIYWPSSRRRNEKGDGKGGGSSSAWGTAWGGMPRFTKRMHKSRQTQRSKFHDQSVKVVYQSSSTGTNSSIHPTVTFQHPTPPPNSISPISRADTISAASTEYVVHYHPVREPTPTIEEVPESRSENDDLKPPEHSNMLLQSQSEASTRRPTLDIIASGLSMVPNPFRRQRTTPPPEVAQAMANQATISKLKPDSNKKANDSNNLRERFHFRGSRETEEPPRQVIVVPAPPRKKRSYSEIGNASSDPPSARFGSDDQPAEAVVNGTNASRSTSSVAVRNRTDSPRGRTQAAPPEQRAEARGRRTDHDR